MSAESRFDPPKPPDANLRTIDATLRHLGRKRVGEPVAVADSVRDDNYRVETASGPLFVRLHRRTRSRDRIELNLAAMSHAGRCGIPVPMPLGDTNGRCLFSEGGRFVSIYPWVEHATLARGVIGIAEAGVLGEMHGRLHVALSSFADPRLEVRGILRWDTEQAIATLSRIDDLIRYYPAPPEASLAVQRDLRVQLELLESGAALPDSAFRDLACQPVHGDYHERNVLLGPSGAVAAVVDWDMVGLAPPALELVHSLDFVGLFEAPRMLAYVAGYRRHMPLDSLAIGQAVELWWQVVLHDTWAFRTYFVEGDSRPARFFPEIEPRLRKFADPGFRSWLTETLRRSAT